VGAAVRSSRRCCAGRNPTRRLVSSKPQLSAPSNNLRPQAALQLEAREVVLRKACVSDGAYVITDSCTGELEGTLSLSRGAAAARPPGFAEREKNVARTPKGMVPRAERVHAEEARHLFWMAQHHDDRDWTTPVVRHEPDRAGAQPIQHRREIICRVGLEVAVTRCRAPARAAHIGTEDAVAVGRPAAADSSDEDGGLFNG
jgi:hypothetical protein